MAAIDIALEILEKYHHTKSCYINFGEIDEATAHKKLKDEIAGYRERLDECG